MRISLLRCGSKGGGRPDEKNACLATAKDADRGMERKESETSRDGEGQQAMEGGLQMGNEMSWESSK